MGSVIALEHWRARRDHPSIAFGRPAAGRRAAPHSRGCGEAPHRPEGVRDDRDDEPGLEALEKAIGDLLAAMARLDPRAPAEPELETELLAVVGELAMGWVDGARRRAERAAARLASDLSRKG